MKPRLLLKHAFIPHEGNDYKPHFFRELSIITVLLISIFLLGLSMGSSFFIHRTVLGVNIANSVLVDLTNEKRLALNESPLLRNTLLDAAAELKADDMVKEGYFAHVSPVGVSPWHWFKEAGYEFLYAGENLAINFTESKDVVDGWYNSPTHRANLLSVNFKDIGMAIKEGMYQGEQTLFVVQMFGTLAKEQHADVPVQKLHDVPEKETVVQSTVLLVDTQAPSTDLARDPEVRGEGTSTLQSMPTSTLMQLVMTDTLSIVQDTSMVEASSSTLRQVPVYSRWHDRIVFWWTHYVDVIYRLLFTCITIAYIVMMSIELRKQHWKHILYGVGILAALLILIQINTHLL